jgi:hypothetical protein
VPPHPLPAGGVDLVQIARQVADLPTPTAPKGFSYVSARAAFVLADPDKSVPDAVQSVSNAVAVAKARRLRSRPWPCDPAGEQTGGGSYGPCHLLPAIEI